MSGELIYSVEVLIVHCPGDGDGGGVGVEGAIAVPGRGATTVRYCDICRRWGATGSTHLCRENWRPRLSDLLIDLGREGRR